LHTVWEVFFRKFSKKSDKHVYQQPPIFSPPAKVNPVKYNLHVQTTQWFISSLLLKLQTLCYHSITISPVKYHGTCARIFCNQYLQQGSRCFIGLYYNHAEWVGGRRYCPVNCGLSDSVVLALQKFRVPLQWGFADLQWTLLFKRHRTGALHCQVLSTSCAFQKYLLNYYCE